MKKLFFVLAIGIYASSTYASTISLFSNNAIESLIGNDDKEKKKSCKKSDSCCKKADGKEKACKKDGESKSCKKEDKKTEENK